ncbi:hypothetical protein KBD75_00460 [Candidatus Woesebacteria bacterium]|nr:hypothetical protein [Candidatus Woesebacteria bacterium]
MNSIFAIVSTTIFFIFSGWYLTYLLPKLEKVERVGLAFLLGAGLTTFIWYIVYRVGLPLNLYTLALAGFILSALSYLLTKVLKLSILPLVLVKLSISEKRLTLAIIFGLIIAFTIGIYHPLTAWDSIAQYDFRGHAIAIDHDLSFIKAGAYFLSYPLMISLVHAVVYLLGGASAQGIHAIIFASFIAIVYGRMKDWTNSKYALLTCLLLVGQNELFDHATFAYTNLPYTSYLVAGILYAISSGAYSLIISALLVGSSTWVRSAEVFWLVGLLLFIIQSVRVKKISYALVSIFIIMGMRSAWSSYVVSIFKSIGFPTETNLSHVNIDVIGKIIPKLEQIYWYLYLNIILPYLGIWFLIIPTLAIIFIKKSNKLLLLVSTVILSAGIAVGGVMIFSTYYPTWNEIGDSARRMILFIVPLTLITAIYALYLLDNKEKNEN